ncbi:hypothetical protein JI735_28950 [Paenibacillus sonchi]|uniref:Lipoprotein n=1 Tax=Paenibacillus sonchi TaxID=373687 RepID=A0A974PAU6_9BACL|nr:hypothetical protein [Paenibacillus sonchi]QQZ60479.1 hypothetical protein JI735_28950 [Paenibacillus sonchi]
MKKFFFVILISFLFLSACSSQQGYSSAYEAISSIEENVTPTDSSSNMNLEGIQPSSYQLPNEEIISVYEFDSTEERDAGKKHFDESTQLLSSHAPIVYQAGNYLVFYYSSVASKFRTPEINETTYGAKIEKALKSIE